MKITTQAEIDALPKSFPAFTTIEICGPENTWLQLNFTPENSRIIAWESSHVVARGSSHVEAWGSSHVVAWGSSHVEARESSHVEARESSHVVARESSHVEAWGSSHVEAWGSSHVEAWGSSHVEAWGSSHVEAWGSSHVVARESSHVEAWGSAAIHNHSTNVSLELYGFAVAILTAKAKTILKKSKTCRTVLPTIKLGVKAWLEGQAICPTAGNVILFKRVSKDFKTQETTVNETVWTVGATLDHPRPALKTAECGVGKYHFCSRPYFCDEFRSNPEDKYIALSVPIKSLYAWPDAQYPHKIAGIKATVLYECDHYGNKL